MKSAVFGPIVMGLTSGFVLRTIVLGMLLVDASRPSTRRPGALRLSGRADERRAHGLRHSKEDHHALAAAEGRKWFNNLAKSSRIVLPGRHPRPDRYPRRLASAGHHRHSRRAARSRCPSACRADNSPYGSLSLSEIKSEHTDGVIRRELESEECARWPEQPAVPAHGTFPHFIAVSRRERPTTPRGLYETMTESKL
jgi:hypothetical protein